MSVIIKRTGTAVQVLEGAHTLPEGTAVQLYTRKELQAIARDHLAMVDLQMPSFIRGDEDEDAAELFFL